MPSITWMSPQCISLTTNSSGQISWTFPNAYASGTVPICSWNIMVVDNNTYIVRPLSVSNTDITLQILYIPITTILGISVMGAPQPVGSGILVHITANRP